MADGRKAASGGIFVNILNGYALDNPILFVSRNADGSMNLHARVKARVNTGGDENGREYKADAELDYWGGAAEWACSSIKRGTRITGSGRLQSWLKPTGKILADGKPEYNPMTNTIRMDGNYHGGPTFGEIADTINKGLDMAKEQGLIPPNVNITGEFFVPLFKSNFQKFDWVKVNATGKLGNARVYDKTQNGFVVPNGQNIQQNAQTPANDINVEAMIKKMESMEKELAALKAAENTEVVENGAAEQAGAAEVDPMAGV